MGPPPIMELKLSSNNSYFLRPVHGQNLATPPQRFPSPWLLQRECFFFSNILTKSHERYTIKYTQWSSSTFPSLMELDTKGFSPFCYCIQRPNGLFWSFADRDVNSPIFSSPMGDEKNSHLNLTVQESTMTTKKSLLSQPTPLLPH